MYKLIGSLLILVASSGIGISKAQELKKHLEELEEVKKIFYLLRGELQYTHAPFAEVFEKIAQKTAGIYQVWLAHLAMRLREKRTGSFWEIWCDSIEQDLQESRMKSEEKNDLQNVGRNLEYIESIDLYIEQLEYRITHTREVYQTKTKLCRNMGIMGGIFLVILLL